MRTGVVYSRATMKDPRPQPIHRKDYRPPGFWIDEVELHFELGATCTRVRATLGLTRP